MGSDRPVSESSPVLVATLAILAADSLRVVVVSFRGLGFAKPWRVRHNNRFLLVAGQHLHERWNRGSNVDDRIGALAVKRISVSVYSNGELVMLVAWRGWCPSDAWPTCAIRLMRHLR